MCCCGQRPAPSTDPESTLHTGARLRDCQRVGIRTLIEPLARAQQGLVTIADLRALGLKRGRIYRAARRGELIRRARGVFALPEVPPEPNLAATIKAIRGVLSHDTAAMWWGMELAHTPTKRHATVPRNRGRLANAIKGWRLHRSILRHDEIHTKDGVAVSSPVRTVVDCARILSVDYAVAIADSALRKRLVTIHELLAVAASIPCGPGRSRVLTVVNLADPKAGSVLESLTRVLLWRAGLFPVETQYPFESASGPLVGYVDFAWPQLRLLLEADGFEFHSKRADHRNDCRRLNAFTCCGWLLLRVTWEDVVFHPDEVVETVRTAMATAAALVA